MALNVPECISTVQDLAELVPALLNQDGEWMQPPMSLLTYILKADAVIKARLKNLYGSDLTSTPYSGNPMWIQDANTGTATFYGAAAGASAISEMWTLTFTSTTAFTVTGTHSKVQNSGSTASAYTSTNGYLAIPTASWTGTPAIGDVFYVSTYNYEQDLVRLSALLASSTFIESVYSEQTATRSSVGAARRAEVNAILERLSDPFGEPELSIPRILMDMSPIKLDGSFQDIDDYGNWTHTLQDEETPDH